MPRVLILESNHILAEQYGQAFRLKGYQADICRDAQKAILAADKNRPDIVVLELILSPHSGIEFLYEFRSYSEWKDIPVLVVSRVTEHGLGLSRRVISELGIKEIIYKPEADMAKLLSKAGRWLQRETTSKS